MEAVSIRRIVESTGGCVKLKTVTGIRRSGARNTFTEKRVYLALNSLWDWEPVERLEQRNDVPKCCFADHYIPTYFKLLHPHPLNHSSNVIHPYINLITLLNVTV